MKKERPILFSTDMVRALLDGRKTQTRRLLKLKPLAGETPRTIHPDGSGKGWIAWLTLPITAQETKEIYGNEEGFKCPHGEIGDILYVRETWCYLVDENGYTQWDQYHYRADDPNIRCMDADGFHKYRKDGTEASPWISSIHMPKEASRIWLEITDIRAQRIQEISEADVKAEGARDSLKMEDMKILMSLGDWKIPSPFSPHQFGFLSIWCKINGCESWLANPWVWALSFKILSTTGKPPAL